ncbi:porin [Cupriavidus basilensis]
MPRGSFSAGLGYSRDAKTGGLVANDFRDKIQATAAYDFKVINVYGVYGRDRRYNGTASTRTDVRYWLAGFSVPCGALALTLNYMERDVQDSTSGRLRKAQAGYGYRLSKRTLPYVFDYEDGNNRKAGDTVVTYGIGIQHKF